jgi:hypothetical protein
LPIEGARIHFEFTHKVMTTPRSQILHHFAYLIVLICNGNNKLDQPFPFYILNVILVCNQIPNWHSFINFLEVAYNITPIL